MNPPDWPRCNEGELWRYVAWHLEGAGIRSVLVGGAVVAIYTDGLYRSGDLDMVPDDFHRDRIKDVLCALGFEPSKSRYFRHPSCPHLFLEFPRGSVEIGKEFPLTPDGQSARVNLVHVQRWCEKEGGALAFEELARSLGQSE